MIDNEDDDVAAADMSDESCAVTEETDDVDSGTRQLNGLLNESIILLRLVTIFSLMAHSD